MMNSNQTTYRWVILALVWSVNFSCAVIQLSGGPVQLVVASEFNLNASQVATWINLPLLAIAIGSIPAGILVDRLHARKALMLGMLFAAFSGITRGLAPSFLFLSFSTFLFGVGQALVLSGMPKAVLEWFPHREVGRAVGIYTSAAAIGVIAVFTGAPLLFHSDWRSLFLWTGGLALVVLLLWVLLGRSRGGEIPHEVSPGSLKEQFLELLGERDVLVLCAICAATQVGIFGWLAFGFPFLVVGKSASAEVAGTVVSVTMLGFLVGALGTSSVSDRLGKRRPFFSSSGLLSAGLLVLLPYLPVGPLMWLAVFVLGLCFATLQVLLFALPLELPSVGDQRVGACEGIIISIGFFAGIAASPLLGLVVGDFETATAGAFQIVLLLMAVLLFLAGLICRILPETGMRR